MVPQPKFKEPKHFSKTKDKGSWYCNVCAAPERANQESMTRADAVRHERTRAHTRLVERQQQQEAWQPAVDYSGWEAPAEWYTSWDASSRVDKMPDYIPFWRDGVMAAERGEQVGKLEDFLEQFERNIRQRNSKDGQWGHDIGLNMWGGSPALDAWGVKKQAKPAWKTEQWDGPETGWGIADTGAGWGIPDAGDDWNAVDTGSWGVPADADPWAIADETGWGAREADWGVSTATESSRKGDSSAANKVHGDVSDRDLRTFMEKIVLQEHASPARREQMRKFSELSTEDKIRQIQDAARVLRSHA
ncbi:hypothetical protein DAEQUDRAFT_808763 [Daedalea quercina L-15889]|uniref:Uncharacterized protein n=1 Tax=Daedalea quercina L-15889 TaxID=1314783 RepID=A0A165T113_9APHY|nr:hypothetical protein DAEQUDRAFT_808763 [Daedalea quercina L-15889]